MFPNSRLQLPYFSFAHGKESGWGVWGRLTPHQRVISGVCLPELEPGLCSSGALQVDYYLTSLWASQMAQW